MKSSNKLIASQSHIFSLFSDQELSQLIVGRHITVTEHALVKRLTHVLRAERGDEVIIFDKKNHTAFTITNISKQAIEGSLIHVEHNKALLPQIHWLLPLLERDAFEKAIAGLTVLGATSIEPFVTRKVHRRALSPKEHERIHRIMIAAAEQSKQFVLPEIKPVATFESLRSRSFTEPALFFDPVGMHARDMIALIEKSPPPSLRCMVGPEGDLTVDEKSMLKELHFSFVALTPSILRSEDAAFIATGLLRSMLR